ncbi:helix-turn-helix domain-containing protein [Methylocystis sp. JAN1]
MTVAKVAERLGVSPATFYRYLPAARTANNIFERASANRCDATSLLSCVPLKLPYGSRIALQ